MLSNCCVYLASQSPRRAELLRQIQVKFVTLIPNIDECLSVGELPENYVRRMAIEKAQAAAKLPRAESAWPILAADTTVVCAGTIMGKPQNEADFTQMMQTLSGQQHEVLTAIALLNEQGLVTRLSRNEVSFRKLTPVDIAQYWACGEPRDKAGGYGIQGLGAQFITAIKGSYSGIVGLPLEEVASLLAH